MLLDCPEGRQGRAAEREAEMIDWIWLGVAGVVVVLMAVHWFTRSKPESYEDVKDTF